MTISKMIPSCKDPYHWNKGTCIHADVIDYCQMMIMRRISRNYSISMEGKIGNVDGNRLLIVMYVNSTSPKRPQPSPSEQQQRPKRPKISVPSFQEIEDLDPDLASILPGTAPSPSSTSQSPSRATSHSPAPAQKVLIKVCYTTPRIPDDERLQVLIDKLKKPLSIYVMEVCYDMIYGL